MRWKGTVRTQGDRLNVRETPGGRVIGKLENGEEVCVTGDAGEWLLIEYGEGEGCVAKRYVTMSQAQTQIRIVDSQGNAFEPVGSFTVSVIGND